MTFKELTPGDLFLIAYDYGHGLSVKLDAKTAKDLFTGETYGVNYNKKVESPRSLEYDKNFFLAWHKGKPVIARRVAGGFNIFVNLIVKSEIIRNPLELQGIPYDQEEKVDIILQQILQHADAIQNMAKTLATLRQTT